MWSGEVQPVRGMVWDGPGLWRTCCMGGVNLRSRLPVWRKKGTWLREGWTEPKPWGWSDPLSWEGYTFMRNETSPRMWRKTFQEDVPTEEMERVQDCTVWSHGRYPNNHGWTCPRAGGSFRRKDSPEIGVGRTRDYGTPTRWIWVYTPVCTYGKRGM